MIRYMKVNAVWSVVAALVTCAGLVTYNVLIWEDDIDPGLWTLIVSFALGIGFGQALFRSLWDLRTLRVRLAAECLQDLKVTVEENEDGTFTALASNEHVATTLRLPEGYDPHEDRGVLMMELLAKELIPE